MLFDTMQGIVRVIVISIAAYAALIVVLRMAGKRSLAKLNAFDLVVTVALGSTLATILLSKDVALAEGVLAFVMLALLQLGLSKASVRWRGFQDLVQSEPRLLFQDGQYLHRAMRDERVTPIDVQAAVRKQGIGRLEEVAAVILETDGSFSVIRKGGDGELTALGSVQPAAEGEG